LKREALASVVVFSTWGLGRGARRFCSIYVVLDLVGGHAVLDVADEATWVAGAEEVDAAFFWEEGFGCEVA
jgi:hypothetical protein